MNASESTRLHDLFERDIESDGTPLPPAEEIHQMFTDDGLNERMDRALLGPNVIKTVNK